MGSYNGGLIKYDPATVGFDEIINESFAIKNAFFQNDVFTFELTGEAENYFIYDLQGKLILSSESNQTSYQIPVHNLTGIYVMTFSDSRGKIISLKVFVP
jgi:hypothetical protein